MNTRLSIAFKLAILISATMLLMAYAVNTLIRSSVDKTIDKIVQEEFDQSLNMAQNYFDFLAQSANLTAVNIAEDHTLQGLFLEQNFGDYATYLEHRRHDLNCDQILTLDHQGNLLAQAGSLPFEGSELMHFDFVRTAFESHTFQSSIIRQGDVFVLYSATPLNLDNTDERLEGLILVGLTLNNLLMEHMKKSTKMEFSIVGDRAMAATSFTDNGQPMGTLPIPYTEYLWILKNSKMLEATINGDAFYIAAKPLQGIDPSTNASIMLAYRSGELEQDRLSLDRTIFVFMSLAVLLAIVIAIIISRYFTSIILSIINMTRRIKSGDYKARLAIKSKDEFGELAENLNMMGEAILEKDMSLKAYADSLEDAVAKRTSELNLQKNYLRSILDLQPNMVMMIEEDNVVFINRAFSDFFSLDETVSSDKPKNLSALFGYDYHKPENVHRLAECLKSVNALSPLHDEIEFFDTNSIKHYFRTSYTTVLESEPAYLVVFNDISAMKQEQDKLYKMATTDTLTGLSNRLRFNDEIMQAINHYQRYEHDTFLILFDIDDFKKINDTYGHDVGDDAIRSIAEMLRTYMRASDVCARWGGEEFAVILYNTTDEQAEIVADLLRTRIEEEEYKGFGHMTCSFGLTKIAREDTTESLFKRADKALYNAKESGKNRVITLWEEDQEERS
ncbi:MAG: diguanylate cyclase [Sulfurimonadaceae bacterium]|nr:diguanylate cyclase [Sulfurimonadaceae bacterium]